MTRAGPRAARVECNRRPIRPAPSRRHRVSRRSWAPGRRAGSRGRRVWAGRSSWARWTSPAHQASEASRAAAGPPPRGGGDRSTGAAARPLPASAQSRKNGGGQGVSWRGASRSDRPAHFLYPTLVRRAIGKTQRNIRGNPIGVAGQRGNPPEPWASLGLGPDFPALAGAALETLTLIPIGATLGDLHWVKESP